MRKQFVSTVERIIKSNDELVLLLGDIGVFGFRNSLSEFPDRVYNIGILEQTTVSMAAGLSKTGLIPVVHTIAPFVVERAYEQLKIDFGYQRLGGNFVSIGSSYDYCNLGPTHHCPGDVHILKRIPNFQIVVPGSSKEFDLLFNHYYDSGFPTYFRLSDFENKQDVSFDPGKASVIKVGSLATVICVGNMLDAVVDATSDLDVTLLYYNVIEPFDSQSLIDNFNENIVICEPYFEGLLNFEVNRLFSDVKTRVMNVGVPHKFFDDFGSKIENDEKVGLDSSSIRKKIKEFING